MIIYAGCDHAGWDLKQKVIAAFPHIEWKDFGTHNGDSVDYTDYADQVCAKITQTEIENKEKHLIDSMDGQVLGLLICGSGQGMAMRANRYSKVRAALCWNEDIARLAREHNNANVICLSARFTSPDQAIKMVQTFLQTKFEGGRHQRRVDKLSADTGC
ncbi:MAG: RpiB/LacA/LacB family sugar-phosphate isomerase [Pseudobdellovibrionaceae bacterium]